MTAQEFYQDDTDPEASICFMDGGNRNIAFQFATDFADHVTKEKDAEIKALKRINDSIGPEMVEMEVEIERLKDRIEDLDEALGIRSQIEGNEEIKTLYRTIQAGKFPWTDVSELPIESGTYQVQVKIGQYTGIQVRDFKSGIWAKGDSIIQWRPIPQDKETE